MTTIIQHYKYRIILTKRGKNIETKYEGFRTDVCGNLHSLKGIYTGDMNIPFEVSELENEGKGLLKKFPKSKELILVLEGKE